MARITIDYGIDLGTTNSSIAELKGTEVDVIENYDEGLKYTPSAVWVGKKNELFVGKVAKERLEDDRGNAFCEFKLQMGTAKEYVFASNGRKMHPEELSAEVLKSLKNDVKRRSGEDIQAAVITVPAAFELPQCDATRKAALLAGFSQSPLLQEPVAAALAYGFQSKSDKVFWLVYDFGGGTFDAAVIQVRDGVIQVVNHGGDNQLGGKLLDWEIVEQLLIPAVTKEHRVADFKRGNPKWISAIAKLKCHAEEAKIRVSRNESVEIHIEHLCLNDNGQSIDFEYELKRTDVERLFEPFILRSINICKRVLSEKRLSTVDIEKVLLVGGPTLTPYLRERLSDKKEGLGILLEFKKDPLTVVAQGAAIFAGTQRLENIVQVHVAAGQYNIELDYKPVGSDPDPLVGGRVISSNNENFSGFTIEFTNIEAKPHWRSGKIGLSPNGSFMANLWAEKGKQNILLIEVCDAKGTKRETVPDRLPYTIGMTITDPPLIHSVGIALANNEVMWFFKKGVPLPVRGRNDLHTAFYLSSKKEDQQIQIPVIEGDNERADRNESIGELVIHSKRIKRDLPAGSDIEVTLEIDQSRIVRVKAYIPLLDEEYEAELKYESYRKIDAQELHRDFSNQKKRLETAREKVNQFNDSKAQEGLHKIDGECMLHEVETSLAASGHDSDAADKCQKRLRELKIAIDEMENALEWPALVTQAEKETEVERNIVNNENFDVTAEEKSIYNALEREIRNAITNRNRDVLMNKIADMDRLGIQIVIRQPGWWVGQLENLEKKKSTMSNESLADNYFQQGRRAINNNDIEALKASVRQLWGLLPIDDADRQKAQSGVMK